MPRPILFKLQDTLGRSGVRPLSPSRALSDVTTPRFAATALGSVANTNTGTKTITATPAVGDTIVLFIVDTGVANPVPTPSDNNADGLGTYTLVRQATEEFFLTAWIRDQKIGSASSTIFSNPAGTSTGGAMYAVKVTGLTLQGTAAVRQGGLQDFGASGAAPTITLPQAALASNILLGAVYNHSDPPTLTPPSGWVEQGEISYLTPTTGLEVASVDSGVTASTVTWGSTSATGFAAVALELTTDPTAIAQITGASTLTFSPTSTLTGAGALVGASTLTFAPAGTIVGIGALLGASTFTFAPSATLTGAGALAGASTLSFAPSGTITGRLPATGSSTLSFSPTGTLSGIAQLTGASSLTFAPSGTLTGLSGGALTGSTSLSFTPRGTISAFGLWVPVTVPDPSWAGSTATGTWTAETPPTPSWSSSTATGTWTPIVPPGPSWS